MGSLRQTAVWRTAASPEVPARYTHRVAISNRRLVALQNGSVTFRWKDYAHGNQPAMMTLQATEFIRRFLLHVLPKGLVRIRHFGFLANRCRRQKISLCRKLLDVALPTKPQGSNPRDDSLHDRAGSQAD